MNGLERAPAAAPVETPDRADGPPVAAGTGRDPAPSGSGAPLVTVVTPVYNGERFLAETMDAVQAQTYPNLVHCVLDNASTDGSRAIIERYANRRVPVIRARNAATLSQVDNWNAALALMPPATKYFRVLPADDTMEPDALAKMVALAEEHPEVGVVGCQERLGDRVVCRDLDERFSVFDGRAIVRDSLLGRIRGFPHVHCLLRRESLDPSRPFYDGEMYGVRLLAFDLDAVMRILSESRFGFVHETLVHTRVHPFSVSSTERDRFKENLFTDLQLIDRWGPRVFPDPREFEICRRRHLRFYYRHLALWFVSRRADLLDRHCAWLRKASALPSFRDFAAAINEWPVRKVGRVLGGCERRSARRRRAGGRARSLSREAS